MSRQRRGLGALGAVGAAALVFAAFYLAVTKKRNSPRDTPRETSKVRRTYSPAPDALVIAPACAC